ncbi:hypothetical protein O185_07485 [Photorhabdus temperata J3]|uniref:Uncharacterized protein n=1 Tax=Photorhabdus temperata J3 TaxID=1389415 RepID=U7R138_PHOTE|nr:hypothetical protein O185_07485 [Photorhabdus temperata J3]
METAKRAITLQSQITAIQPIRFHTEGRWMF